MKYALCLMMLVSLFNICNAIQNLSDRLLLETYQVLDTSEQQGYPINFYTLLEHPVSRNEKLSRYEDVFRKFKGQYPTDLTDVAIDHISVTIEPTKTELSMYGTKGNSEPYIFFGTLNLQTQQFERIIRPN